MPLDQFGVEARLYIYIHLCQGSDVHGCNLESNLPIMKFMVLHTRLNTAIWCRLAGLCWRPQSTVNYMVHRLSTVVRFRDHFLFVEERLGPSTRGRPTKTIWLHWRLHAKELWSHSPSRSYRLVGRRLQLANHKEQTWQTWINNNQHRPALPGHTNSSSCLQYLQDFERWKDKRKHVLLWVPACQEVHLAWQPASQGMQVPTSFN